MGREEVDLEQYSGLWFEILRTENYFEDAEMKNITSLYELINVEGKHILWVTNSFQAHGHLFTMSGRAVKTNYHNTLSLKFFAPGSSESFYTILFVDKNYKFAVIRGNKKGSNKANYWFLAREKKVEQKMIDLAILYIQKSAKMNGQKVKIMKSVQD